MGICQTGGVFVSNAFVELVKWFDQERYEFILNETQTYQIIMDVRNRFSDLGILYLSRANDLPVTLLECVYGILK